MKTILGPEKKAFREKVVAQNYAPEIGYGEAKLAELLNCSRRSISSAIRKMKDEKAKTNE